MKKLFMTGAAAAATGLFLATSAHAADLYTPPPEPPAPVPHFTWAGPYIGAQIGYGWGDGKAKGQGEDFDPDGIVGGGFLGYNMAFGRHFVLGAEADFNGSGLSDKYDNAAGSHKFKERFFGSLRARLGYSWGRTLLYVAGGWAFSKAKFEYEGVKDKNWHHGWTIGGGIDHAFTDSLFGRIEYRYTDYGSETYDVAPDHRIDYSDNKVLVGLGWKF